MNYYTAGGTVRDILLGKLPKDHDVVFAAMPESFIALNPLACKVGAQGVFLLGGHEYTQMRGNLPQEDVLKRDITINAFLLEENGLLHMHPLALHDLQNKLLHPAYTDSFKDDPLRVFRVARFAACLPDFTPTPQCLDLMRKAGQDGLLENIAPERVGHELLLALQGNAPGNFLRVLEQAGCLSPWFCPLEVAGQIPAGPPLYHNSSVLEHSAQVMDKTAQIAAAWHINSIQDNSDLAFVKPGLNITAIAVWMALCHDLGKAFTPTDMLPHHYGHEAGSRVAAEALVCRLALSTEYRKAAALSSILHMKAGRYHEHRPAIRVDLLMQAHAAGMSLPLFLMAQADSGRDYLWRTAKLEMRILLAVGLPPEWQNMGAQSGQRLRTLRCNALPSRPVVL